MKSGTKEQEKDPWITWNPSTMCWETGNKTSAGFEIFIAEPSFANYLYVARIRERQRNSRRSSSIDTPLTQ